ncbi:CPBP family intramembrane metalloprotease [Thalassotalea sp. LPB0316]|uniref:CPBP family intramembrane glutamic endopeptidase n=1 Tax=Thalassotalea sp. LPB0316 TaxID=2769490 RepID=UPI001867232C|nr:CPBP family intramembrane glutamic endopeptidase [Thalassotalea sp. LPB0316]QOL25844.1 CPBP family intramembrane metalloprotease [Thalassotalea sp. LPB0316]
MRNKENINWSITETFWLGIGIVIMSTIFDVIAFKTLNSISIKVENAKIIMQILHQLFIIFLLIFLKTCKTKDSLLKYFEFNKTLKIKDVCKYFTAYFLLLVIEYFISNLNAGSFNDLSKDTTYYTNAIPYFLLIVLIAPIAEELFFRGFLYKGWCENAKNKYIGYISISFLFTLLHWQTYDLLALAWIFLFSVFLCHIRNHSQTITAPILIHSLNNLIGFLSLYINFEF